MSLKWASNGDCFSKRNLRSSPCKAKSLASDLPLEIHLFLCIREDMCSASISLQSCVNRRVKYMYFNVIDDFNHICQNAKIRWHFAASHHFYMDDTVCRLTFRTDLFHLSSETRKLSSHSSYSGPAYTNTKWLIQFSWYVIIQGLEWFWSLGVGWQQKYT